MKTYFRVTVPACGVVVLFCLVSCAGEGGERLSHSAQSPVEASTALLMDESLAGTVEIQDQSLSRDENGVILAETLIVNQSDTKETIEVRCLFKDQLGMTQETSPWKKLILEAKGRSIYVAPSLNQYAVRFITQIRKSE